MSELTSAVLLAFGVTAGFGGPRSAWPIQSYDSYQNWFVACDNTLTCVAKGFDDGSGGAEIRIERHAGADGELVASISSIERFEPSDIRIDGTPAGLGGAAWEYTSSSDGSSITSSDYAAIRALIRKLRNATHVTMGSEETVPLAGFSAAMLRLDDRQGRIDGVTALLKSGSRPASSVPLAPPLPHIGNHPIQAHFRPGEGTRLVALVRADQKALFAEE